MYRHTPNLKNQKQPTYFRQNVERDRQDQNRSDHVSEQRKSLPMKLPGEVADARKLRVRSTHGARVHVAGSPLGRLGKERVVVAYPRLNQVFLHGSSYLRSHDTRVSMLWKTAAIIIHKTSRIASTWILSILKKAPPPHPKKKSEFTWVYRRGIENQIIFP